MNPPQSPNEFLEFLQKEREIATQLRDEMNRDFVEKRVSGFKDKRQK